MYLGVKLDWLIKNVEPESFQRQFMKLLLVDTKRKLVFLKNGDDPVMLEVPYDAITDLKRIDQCTS